MQNIPFWCLRRIALEGVSCLRHRTQKIIDGSSKRNDKLEQHNGRLWLSDGTVTEHMFSELPMVQSLSSPFSSSSGGKSFSPEFLETCC